MRGSLFPLFPLFWWPMSCQDNEIWTTKLGEIGEIGTLSWFWHFTLRGNRANRIFFMVLEENRYVCRYTLTFFGDWLDHASEVMLDMDENMIENVFGIYGYWVNKYIIFKYINAINKCRPRGPGFYPIPIYIYFFLL